MSRSSKTTAIARIVMDSGHGVEEHAGMAIVVDDRHVMTCCHVLNDAMRRTNRLDPVRPSAEQSFTVHFPYGSTASAVGRVLAWGLDQPRPKDVAVLVLDGAGSARPDVALFSEAEVEGQRWSCTGYDRDGDERAATGILGPVLAQRMVRMAGLRKSLTATAGRLFGQSTALTY
jgi:hypothetical protein